MCVYFNGRQNFVRKETENRYNGDKKNINRIIMTINVSFWHIRN